MMAGETPAPAYGGESEVTETASVFIPKESLGGREYKPGEKLTFTVKDVDPETGEVEALVEGYEADGGEKVGAMAEAIDAMPDNE